MGRVYRSTCAFHSRHRLLAKATMTEPKPETSKVALLISLGNFRLKNFLQVSPTIDINWSIPVTSSRRLC
jgi:hypothetical protein